MSRIAITFGVLLCVLSGVIFALAEKQSATIFIPAGFGILLIVLGVVARNEKARMHAMHSAALIGLIGMGGGIVQGIRALTGDRPATVWGGSFGMAALCGAFVVMCIQSFIAARRARKQNPT